MEHRTPNDRRSPLSPEQELPIRFQAKRELRKRLTHVRKLLPLDARREANAAICASLKPFLQGVRTVALFRAIGSKGEIDLTPIDTEARALGVKVAYPAIDQGADEDDVIPIGEATMSFRFADRLAERGHGFEEPSPDAELATELDLIIVPALALDERGFRLGYGAGLYDRTLPRFPSARTIGVAYDFQLLMEVPHTEGDVPVQTIVTDKRVIEVRR
ncbi:MAG: 5-formyltetrahydrofolate cyclo-ligase [Polyangiales bacterium]